MEESEKQVSVSRVHLNDGLYIAKLEDGVWIAPWSGDPGRTLKKENAKKFKTKRAAYLAIAEAMLFRDFKNPTIEMYNAEITGSACGVRVD